MKPLNVFDGSRARNDGKMNYNKCGNLMKVPVFTLKASSLRPNFFILHIVGAFDLF